jgi:tripartite-type tricarboxylate transporter receptor subunit TctC
MTAGKAAACAVFSVVIAACSADGWTQAYPTKPVRMIVAFAPGGGTDIVGRVIGQKLTEMWPYPVVLDNRPGAGSTVGTAMAAKAPPDGYSITMTSMSHAINATLYRTLPYDSMKDFAPVILTARAPNVLVVHPSVAAHTVKDLVALAKARPGRLNFSSSGTGGVSHLSAELFNALAGIDVVHIPYKGAGPAMSALIGGEVQVMMATTPVSLPQIKANRVRGLAISSLKRSPLAPGMATIAESGFPGFETDTWYGVLAPAGTPPAVVRRLNTDTARVLEMPDVKAALEQQGAQPAGGSPDEFRRFIQSEIDKWAKAIRLAKVPPAN